MVVNFINLSFITSANENSNNKNISHFVWVIKSQLSSGDVQKCAILNTYDSHLKKYR